MKKFSKREKNLITTALVAIVVFLFFQFAISPFLNYADRTQDEIPRMKGDLLTAKRIAARYQELDRQVKDIRQRLDQRTAEFNPHDFLSTLAGKSRILPNLEDIKLDVTKINKNYQEDTATVRLKGIQLEQLVNYLFDIELNTENSDQLLTIKELSIKPESDNALLLDVMFEVSTFSKTKEMEEGTGSRAVAKPQRSRRR